MNIFRGVGFFSSKAGISHFKCTVALVLLFFVSLQAYSHNSVESTDTIPLEIDDSYFLELRGYIKEGKKKVANATITVYCDSSLFTQVLTDKTGTCEVKLLLNKKYVIKISKPGYVSKTLTINTKIPRSEKAIYIFPFSVDIFKKVEGIDVSVLKEPIAKVAFNNFKKNFEYDYNYTNKINQDLKKLYKDIEKAQAAQGSATAKD